MLHFSRQVAFSDQPKNSSWLFISTEHITPYQRNVYVYIYIQINLLNTPHPKRASWPKFSHHLGFQINRSLGLSFWSHHLWQPSLSITSMGHNIASTLYFDQGQMGQNNIISPWTWFWGDLMCVSIFPSHNLGMNTNTWKWISLLNFE